MRSRYRRLENQNNALVRFFEWAAAALEGAENAFATFAAIISPWMAPVSPAYLSFKHLTHVLGFEPWVAFTVAIVIEALGFSTVYTMMQFIMANRFLRRDEKRRKAPTWVVAMVFAFYVILVVALNVSLEWIASSRVQLARLFVIFLLSVLSVPAGVLVASRTAYRELLDEYEYQKAERMRKKSEIPTNGHHPGEKIPENSENSEKIRYDWRKLSDKDKRSLRGLTWQEIQQLYPGMEERTARNWERRAREDFAEVGYVGQS